MSLEGKETTDFGFVIAAVSHYLQFAIIEVYGARMVDVAASGRGTILVADGEPVFIL